MRFEVAALVTGSLAGGCWLADWLTRRFGQKYWFQDPSIDMHKILIYSIVLVLILRFGTPFYVELDQKIDYNIMFLNIKFFSTSESLQKNGLSFLYPIYSRFLNFKN